MTKKDLNWLKEEIATEMIELEPNRKERWSDVKYQTLRSVAQKLDQLDEPEKLYQVELPTERLHHILTMHVDGKGHFFGKEHINNLWYKTYLTEQEIKAIDERFWSFAVEVAE